MHPLDQLRNFFAGTDDGYILNGIVQGRHPGIAFRDGKPVSYTHLDVYKRQGAHRPCHRGDHGSPDHRIPGVPVEEQLREGAPKGSPLSLIHI